MRSGRRPAGKGATLCRLMVLCAVAFPLVAGRAVAQQNAPLPPQPPLLQQDDTDVDPFADEILDPTAALNIREIELSATPPEGTLPAPHRPAPSGEPPLQGDGDFLDRGWAHSVFYWEAPALSHRPLYFEDINLERYGYHFGYLQPAVSAAHFFGTVPALPYRMTLQRPHERVYDFGHGRPGDPVPYRHYVPPLRVGPGLVEAGLWTGLIFVFP